MKHKIVDLVPSLEWKKGWSDDEQVGFLNGNIMFIIDRKGKRVVTYTLKSFPFHNDIFTRANNYKKLLVVSEENLDELKRYAQTSLNIFVKQFLNNTVS